MSQLRAWQEDALREYSLWTPREGNGFLVEATPGAGKTRLAIEVACRALASGRVQRIVIAVPTARLEGQWAEEFGKQGVSINPGWQAADGRLASDEQGCAATYAEIAKQPQIYRKLISEKPTLVILDEIHHCGGDDRAWGAGVRTAFQPATAKLLLSGTPFRSDNDEIPFVNYVDGVGAPDFRYGYDRALADGVVRAVFFPRRGGLMEWTAPNGDSRRATFEDQLNDREAAHRLRTALSPTGDWLPSVLKEADAQLSELRTVDPQAGGIVFCEDSFTAREVVKLLTALGQSPVLAITDEPDADERIKTFKSSTAAWIVTIRKVSEGVDIPRLRVGVYATPWITELFFRQVVGRLVRIRPGEDDPTAYLYIPDDARLREMAAQIKQQRDHILDQQEAELLGESEANAGPSGEQPLFSLFSPISATPTDEGVIVDSDTITPVELANAEQIKRMDPTTVAMPTALVAKLLRNAGTTAPTAPAPSFETTEAPFERKEKLKKSNNTAAQRIARALDIPHSKVNGHLNKLVGVSVSRGVRQCSEEQLERRLRYAQQWLATGTAPGKEAE
ncbi:DEAD/DEAH box helicase [Nonomuraea rubra]|uniref:Superfamily II DNA or RNA helicase n=1 Tax=Nonomuraea rubra TaxID=46180 RepID=A0A7X0P6E9_9ACTN|nr:DEAD/DEAH box helicase [Nonomuraea rubra]MBB6556121.1 superfamily II DNA or RNA helicase [Nonomuraea rubra]